MDSRSDPLSNALPRAAALLLLLMTAPIWLVRFATRLIRGGRLQWTPYYGHRGAFRALSVIGPDAHGNTVWLLNIISGRMGFLGPEPGRDSTERPERRPGLVSPSRLRRRVGIGHLSDTADDAEFFENATVRHRAGLLLRYLLSGLISASRPTATDPVIELFGVRIAAITMREAVEQVSDWGAAADRPPTKIVSFVNPDCLNKALENREYHYSLGRSDLVLPDGSGLRIAAKLLGMTLSDNVNGTDLFPMLCEDAAKKGQRLFLFGGLPGIAKQAAAAMQSHYPSLKIAGCLDGYTYAGDDQSTVDTINASGADIVLVGLGAPLQENWCHEHRDRLKTAVALGVGGLFDYYSGYIKRAPVWMREAGLEWVWRILQEPRAKWRRYVVGNPLFLWRVFREYRIRRKGIDATRLRKTPPSPAEFARMDTVSAGRGRADAWLSTQLWQLELSIRATAKRMLDIVISASALICLSPLLLATAFSIRIESAGPIFFSQVRVGARGKTFSMYKFRSMFVDAEEKLAALQHKNESADGVLFKMKHDPRITRVGRFIRRFSIDELPQILNVLRGEMSVVGPRPALPDEVSQYRPADRKRLQTKPGLTCLWQIGGRSDLSFEQQVNLDIEYLKGQNLFTDIRIIAATVPAVVSGKGAY